MLSTIIQPPGLMVACHGLVGSANRPPITDNRWELGAKFSPLGCYTLGATEADCPAIEANDLQDCTPFVEFAPYVVTAGFNWAANAPGDPEQIAIDTLQAGLSSTLENLVFGGVAPGQGQGGGNGVNPILSDGVSVGTDIPATVAIGKLEAAILGGGTGDYTAGAGTIYVSPLTAILAGTALTEIDGKLYTKATCSQVIVGNFPETIVAAHVGGVDLYLSDAQIITTRDEYRSNEYDVMAQVLALVIFNPCGLFTATVADPV